MTLCYCKRVDCAVGKEEMPCLPNRMDQLGAQYFSYWFTGDPRERKHYSLK